MRALQNKSISKTGGLTPEILEARLSREKLARMQAETLLEEKSRELYTTNTVLQKVADAVESQRVQLDTILDHTLTGIVLVNSELCVTRANKKAITLFDLGEDYFAELAVQELFEDFTTARDIYDERMQVGKNHEDSLHEAVGHRVDGSTFPLEFGLTCMKIEGRQHSVWIFRDISKRKREEAKRIALEHELSQAQKMESLGTLASGVAHEINTPIQYIGDNLRFMKDTITDLTDLIDLFMSESAKLGDNEDVKKLIETVKNKSEEIELDFLYEEAPLSIDQSLDGISQVASIVNAIKEFSHPGEDDKTEFDLNQLIETALTVTRNQWKYVADVETDLSADLPSIAGLPSDINQVILNLIVNAADAIEEGENEEKGTISIATKLVDRHVVMSINDNGSGIPDDVKKQIFDPFFTTKGVGKGSGQGLAIAYTIIKQKHDGTIECDSKPGVGTTFTISLPLESADSEGESA
ncbi:MAG: ATP-binding protein [Hyphomicrobiales bacterium]